MAAVSFFAYLPALNGGFIWDDDTLVTANRLLRAPDGLYRIWFTTEPADYWPLTNTSFWIEWRLWGMRPTGYHLTNLALHIAASLLIWTILREMEIPGALLAALLFAVHPVNVESVAWIAQRKNTLALVFFLLSVLWYLKAEGSRREPSGGAERRPVWLAGQTRWYWLSVLAFLLAMLSKGSVAILPAILLLIVWWQRGRITRGDVFRLLPFLPIAVGLVYVNVWFQRHGTDEVFRRADFIERLLGAAGTVWFYLYKALVPLNLNFVYPQWSIRTDDLRWWLPLLAVLAVTACLCRWRPAPWVRAVLFAWLFFCIALLPVMGFTDVYFMKYSLVADHYQHIAIIGVIALVAAGWWRAYDWAPEPYDMLLPLGAIVTVGLLAVLSNRQSEIYRDTITLFETTLERNPTSWMAHNNLGRAYAEAHRPADALEQFQATLRLKPDHAAALSNIGSLYQDKDPKRAIEYFEQALRIDPKYADAHTRLAIALATIGRDEEAIEHFGQAVKLNPRMIDAEVNYGIALQQMGRLGEAATHFQRALDQARAQGQTAIIPQIESLMKSASPGRSAPPPGNAK